MTGKAATEDQAGSSREPEADGGEGSPPAQSYGSAESHESSGSTEPFPPATYPGPIETDDLDPDAVKVVRRLVRHDHLAYLVGGSVRDLLLRKQPKDFDVATSARPEEVRRIFRNCRIIGRRFRLAHVIFGGGKVIETATFRRDPSSRRDGTPSTDDDLLIRHDNVFGEPHEDAVRRDFTINGLFYDVEKDAVIDYVAGYPDIRRRLVRTIGDPDVRLQEDPVRMLRAVKFSARLDLGIDPDLYDAIVRQRTDLDRAARPRVFEEILRLLRGGAAQRSVYLLWDTGLLSMMLPELASFLDDDAEPEGLLWERLRIIDRLKAEGRLPGDSVLLAALLMGPLEEWIDTARDPSVAFEEFVGELSLRLAVPRRIKDRIKSMLLSQRRLRAGKLGALPRRDFFADAASLFAIEQASRGEAVPAWAQEPASADVEASPSRRRRGRRRR